MKNTLEYADDTIGFTLSPQQKMVWMQNAGHSTSTIKFVYGAEGNIDANRLSQASQILAVAYEILRTSYKLANSVAYPYQLIEESVELVFNLVNLAGENEDRRQDILDKSRSALTKHEMDSTGRPFMHVSLISLSASQHEIHMELPGMSMDSSSSRILLEALAQAYHDPAVFEEGEGALQYADVAQWLTDVISESDVDAEKFWSDIEPARCGVESLAGVGWEKPVSQQPEYHFVSASFKSLDAVKALASKTDTDVRTLILTCWQTLLYRLSGRNEARIYVCFEGRKFSELEEIPGLLDIWLPFRISLEPALAFIQQAKQVFKQYLDFVEFQEYYNPEAELQDENYYDSIRGSFGFVHLDLDNNIRMNGILFNQKEVSFSGVPFSLTLQSAEKEGCLELKMYYNDEFLDRERAELILSQLVTLIDNIIQKPDLPSEKYALLDDQQKSKVLSVFNSTVQKEASQDSIHRKFEWFANVQPDRTAIVCGEEVLDFRSLNKKANKLARHLLNSGIKSGDRVGICFPPSIDMVVAILAISKIGAAYIPVDPAFPRSRIAYIVDDAALTIILTVNDLLVEFCEKAGVNRMDVESEQKEYENLCSTDLDVVVPVEQTLYLIYTSGSTGKPKGVAIPHRALTSYVNGINLELDLSESAEMAAFSSIASDLGNTALFGALLTGRTLRIFSSQETMDSAALAKSLKKRPLDCLKVVPSHLSALMSVNDSENILPRSCLILGGEKTDIALVKRIAALSPDCKIINHYGPTETTVGATSYTFVLNESRTFPIGTPLKNVQCLVLNDDKEMAAIGEVGILHIGGEGLGHGYKGRPELTAERFIPNIFSACSGARLYDTGDLVRFDSNGNIEFLGRADHQVKIRGYRVELAEIESCIKTIKNVGDAVVTFANDNGNERLDAHVISEDQSKEFEDFIFESLTHLLPHYMLPGAIHFYKSYPRLTNGKIDRKTMAANCLYSAKKVEYVEPVTETQKIIAEIWADQLKLEKVGLLDDFFQLGGHSLATVYLANKFRQTFSCDITIDDMFNNSTLESISQLVDKLKPAVGDVSLTKNMALLKQSDSDGCLYFVIPREHKKTLEEIVEILDFDGSIYSFILPGVVGEKLKSGQKAFTKTVLDMTTLFMHEMRMFKPGTRFLVGGYGLGRSIAYEIFKQMGEQQDHSELFFLSDEQYQKIIDLEARYRGADSTLLIDKTLSNRMIELRKPLLKRNLFLVSPLGAVTCYDMLLSHLDFDGGVYGFQVPSIVQGTKSRFETVKEQAATYVADLLKVQPKGPYYLAGQSIGGCVAYEMAVMLEARGEKVQFIGFLDTIFSRMMDPDLEKLGDVERRFLNDIEGLSDSVMIDAKISEIESREGNMKWMDRYHLVTSLSNLLHEPKAKVEQITYFCAMDCEQERMKKKLDVAQSLSRNPIIRHNIDTSHINIIVELFNVYRIGDIFANILNDDIESVEAIRV